MGLALPPDSILSRRVPTERSLSLSLSLCLSVSLSRCSAEREKRARRKDTADILYGLSTFLLAVCSSARAGRPCLSLFLTCEANPAVLPNATKTTKATASPRVAPLPLAGQPLGQSGATVNSLISLSKLCIDRFVYRSQPTNLDRSVSCKTSPRG